MKTLFFTLIIILISFMLTAQQETSSSCKVLLPSIADKYEGECKKGLAHGTGIAQGKDHYQGEFKKGLPDGNGVYSWSTGEIYDGGWIEGRRDGYGTFSFRAEGKESVLVGYWVGDRYLGSEYRKYEYKILEKRDIMDVRFLRTQQTGNEVRFRIYKGGLEDPGVTDLMLVGSNGYQSGSFLGFDDIEYPFQCQITFNTTNKLNTANLICKLVFEIYEPGRWEVHIQN
jgi:hypothetical protein